MHDKKFQANVDANTVIINHIVDTLSNVDTPPKHSKHKALSYTEWWISSPWKIFLGVCFCKCMCKHTQNCSK